MTLANVNTAADVLVETLHNWGVEVIFGLPGDGINGIMEALRKRQDGIRFIQVRHEETAAFMACGLTYAMAAQIAHPDRQCVAFVGDGGFSMLMADFVTCVKYQLPIKIVIVKNNTLGQIKWEQMVFLGNPEYGCELQSIDYATFASACGGVGFTVDDPAECGDTLDRALATPGPVIVEAVVDPYEPPYPGKMSAEQATNLAESLARGEPNREKIALTVLSDKVKELI
jgi:pyruvate dehydrogenase (quinone)/pyruvate oxidase